MKILFYTITIIVFLLVTFFGLGPVLYADGSMSERMITLAVVLLLYALLVLITIRFVKSQKRLKK